MPDENGAKKTDFQMLRDLSGLFEVDICDLLTFHEKSEGRNSNYQSGYAQSPNNRKDNEFKKLKERERYLDQLNEQLQISLKDKQEIIELLKGRQNS